MSLERAVIAGVGMSEQRKRFEEGSALTLMLDAAKAALADAGIEPRGLDGISAAWPGPGGTAMHPGSVDWSTLLGVPIRWSNDYYPQGVPGLLAAAAAVGQGSASAVLVVNGQSAAGTARSGPATWTQPGNAFTAPLGSTTPSQFALIARAYQLRCGLDEADLAYVSAAIRNQGHGNPEAVMRGRGPYSIDDVLASPPVAEPLRLLDVCLATEGATAIVVAAADRERSSGRDVSILAGEMEWLQQQYVNPPVFDTAFWLGRSFAERLFQRAGRERAEVDVFELYDANSFEVIRQLEALGFCGFGEGPAFVRERGIAPDGQLYVNTDGGLLSFSHPGYPAPTIKIVEAVRQLRGESAGLQAPDPRLALVTGAGSGAQYFNAALLGRA